MIPRGIQKRDVQVTGGRFYYLSAGADDAPLVLCLHGFPDHPPSFCPLMIRLLEANYRVAVPWMRGYHPSVATGPYHLERLALDVVEIANALSPQRPIYAIGHDWGSVALQYALADVPTRFTAAVTMAVPHPLMFLRNATRHPAQLRRSWYMLFFQLPRLPERLAQRRNFDLIDGLWRTWSPDYILPAEARTALHACLAASMPAPLGYYRGLLRPPGQALTRLRRSSVLARRITVPTLYIHGRRDGCVGAGEANGQSQYFAGPFEEIFVDNAGHFLQLEAPDTVASVLIDWFQEFAD